LLLRFAHAIVLLRHCERKRGNPEELPKKISYSIFFKTKIYNFNQKLKILTFRINGLLRRFAYYNEFKSASNKIEADVF
jgi:hypothetical protein